MKRNLTLFSISLSAWTLAVGCGHTPDDSVGSVDDAVKNGENKRNDGDHKVLICHIPPGNPDNAHTISVDESAVEAHLAHGDSLGECAEDSATVSVGSGETTNTTTGGGTGGAPGSSSSSAGGSRDDCENGSSSVSTATAGVGGAGAGGDPTPQ
jgi:hypothetical protein